MYFQMLPEELKEVLGNYVKAVFPNKVHMVRNKENQGLIRARLLGTRLATGDVIVCMDSHMEVQPGWSVTLSYPSQLNCSL